MFNTDLKLNCTLAVILPQLVKKLRTGFQVSESWHGENLSYTGIERITLPDFLQIKCQKVKYQNERSWKNP